MFRHLKMSNRTNSGYGFSSNEERTSRDSEHRHQPEPHYHNAASGPSQHGNRPAESRDVDSTEDRPATNLEILSKEARTLYKRAPLESGDRVVICRYNPTHILDVVDIDHHQKICKDRLRLEKYGCSFKVFIPVIKWS
ncbi:hypothetical protein OSTOST_17382 [Ostertagia ostertagi]